MNPTPQPDPKANPQAPSKLIGVAVRGTLVIALGVLCYQVFSPFLPLMAWSIILAVTLYPLHQWLARVFGKQWLASTLLVIFACLLIIVPTGLLLNSFADDVRNLISGVQNNTLEIPAPSD